MRRTLSAFALLGLTAALALADRPAADPAGLVAQLASREYREREAAAKALDALGEVALPALKAGLDNSTDPELTERAGDLFARITRRVENAKLLAPTLVELDVSDGRTVDALAAIEKQSGYRFYLPTETAPAARAKKITVKTPGKVPFWEAVEQVCLAAGMRVTGTGQPASDPRLSTATVVAGGGVVRTNAFPAQPANLNGYVPAVPDEMKKAIEDEAAKRLAQKQADLEKKAKDVEALWDALQKQAAKAVQPGAPPAPAAARPGAVPPQVAALQAQREALEARRAADLQRATNSVLLDPRPAPRQPASLASAVRVEAVNGGEAHRGGYGSDSVLALLQATPEPRLKLERLDGVRITKAVDADGRELIANKVGLPGGAAGSMDARLAQRAALQQRILINGAGQQVVVFNRADGSLSTVPPVSHRQQLVSLKLGDNAGRAVTKLGELSGVLCGCVRTPPTELVAVKDLYPLGAAASHPGLAGVVLKAAVTEENVDESYNLDVTQINSRGNVTIAQGAVDAALISDRVAKAMSGMSPNARLAAVALNNGLVLTDANGQPFKLSMTRMQTSATFVNGDMVYTRTMRVVAYPTDTRQGKPVKLAFYGTWLKPVDIPFTLTNVPVVAGKPEK